MIEQQIDVAAIYQPDHYILQRTDEQYDLFAIDNNPQTGYKVIGSIPFKPEDFKPVEFVAVSGSVDGEPALYGANVWTVLLNLDFVVGSLKSAIVLNSREVEKARALNKLTPVASKGLSKVFGV